MGGSRRHEAQAERKARALEALAALPFRPSPWLLGGNRQTLYGPALRRLTVVPWRLERWTTPDDDFLRIHILEGAPKAPVAIVLHGLEGNVRSPYVVGISVTLSARGYTVVAMEQRSCGGEMNRARRLYHLGETSDLDFVVERVRARWRGRPIVLAGYSAGGNQIAKWLGERGDTVPDEVAAAAVVSAPFDLQRSGPHLDRALGGFYTRVFMRSLIPKALAKERQYPGILDVARVRASRSFETFDTHATAPLHGFRDAWHYWGESSCGRFLEDVRAPTLLLSARDDPFHPPDTLPEREAERSPWLHGAFPSSGGHVGFVEGGPWRPRYWGEAMVQRFFEQYTGW